MIFILVHGFCDTPAKFKTMQACFERQGHRCIVPALMPNNASQGLACLAEQLRQVIDSEVDTEVINLNIVGFSMGGLIARHYLQALQGHRRVKNFFSLATPHHGSLWAYCYPGLGAAQMRPNSLFLQNLHKSQSTLQAVRCYSYWTPWDLMIVPPNSSVWTQAVNCQVNCLAHPLMVSNTDIMTDILAKATQ